MVYGFPALALATTIRKHDRPMYLELTHSNQAQVAAAIVRPVARGNSASPLYPGKYAVYGLGGNRTI
jgi:hypothetical protein